MENWAINGGQERGREEREERDEEEDNIINISILEKAKSSPCLLRKRGTGGGTGGTEKNGQRELIFWGWSQSYKRNLILKKSKLILNSLTLHFLKSDHYNTLV